MGNAEYMGLRSLRALPTAVAAWPWSTRCCKAFAHSCLEPVCITCGLTWVSQTAVHSYAATASAGVSLPKAARSFGRARVKGPGAFGHLRSLGAPHLRQKK